VIDVAEDELGIDLKKNLKPRSLSKATKEAKVSKEKRK
jgi:hypothetical protein